jgi:hypothetical protein
MLMNRTSARWTASPSCRRPHKSPAHTFKELEVGLSAFLRNPFVSVEVSRLLWRVFPFRQHLFSKLLTIRFPSFWCPAGPARPRASGERKYGWFNWLWEGGVQKFSRPVYLFHQSILTSRLNPPPGGSERSCACPPAIRLRSRAPAAAQHPRRLRLPP